LKGLFHPPPEAPEIRKPRPRSPALRWASWEVGCPVSGTALRFVRGLG
jgi:hypothetical protein